MSAFPCRFDLGMKGLLLDSTLTQPRSQTGGPSKAKDQLQSLRQLDCEVVPAVPSAVSLYELAMVRPDEPHSGGEDYGTQESRILQWSRLI